MMMSRSALRVVAGKMPFRALSAKPAEDIDYKTAKVRKEDLLKLRKRTGYSWVNCKKALVHHPEDIESAVAYLSKLAKEQGWEKAAKVGQRVAAEGLVGLATSGGIGAMAELNCETDFVARNPAFHALLAASTFTALQLAAHAPKVSQTGVLAFDGEELLDMEIPELGLDMVPGKERLRDFLTFTLGKLGEKLELKRAACLTFGEPDVKVVGYAHPRPRAPLPGGILAGQIGTLVALRRSGEVGPDAFPTEALGQQMGQQIIGLRPQKVGTAYSAEEQAQRAEARKALAEAESAKKAAVAAAAPDEGEEGLQETEGGGDTQMDVEQKELLKQDFILHPAITVSDLLQVSS